MNSPRITLVAIVIAASLAVTALAQPSQPAPNVRVVETFSDRVQECQRGQCRLRERSYEWRAASDDRSHVYLYRDGVQIGGWDLPARVWMDYDAVRQVWGPAQDCAPFPAPGSGPVGQAVEPPREFKNFGINVRELAQEKAARCGGGPCYLDQNGRVVGRDEAFAAVSSDADHIPSDGDCLRVTWVGSSDAAAKVRAALGDWKSKVTIQDYRTPAEPILKDLGFTQGLQVQSPSGTPLWYCAEVPDSDGLARGLQVADARRKDPAWDPSKWPNLAKPAAEMPAKPLEPAPPAPNPAPLPWLDWLKSNWLALAAIAAIAYFRYLARKPAAA